MTFSPWRRWKARLLMSSRPSAPRGRFQPHIETLEGRLLLSTYLVTNTNDTGTGSLRQAILDANANPGRDTIAFNIGGGGIRSIALAAPLPVIQDAVILDATTQPGYAGSPLIELNGAGAGATAVGLWDTAGNSVIQGLVINRFSSRGILLQTGGGNVITGNYIGTDVTGRVALPNGAGIDVIASNNNVIGGTTAGTHNLVSGNRTDGISLYSGASNNMVEGNDIGTDVSATFSVGNGYGVGVYGAGTSANTIGGAGSGAGNIISGNGSGTTGDGVSIFLSATRTVVQGNFIGTDVSGLHPLGNAGSGVGISSSGNLVGGSGVSGLNLISGNHNYGVGLLAGATGNQVMGNLIGADATSQSALPNSYAGVGITGGASGNLIGGSAPSSGNIIVGNDNYGVVLFQAGTTGNQVQGNLIGVNTMGQALGNNGYGVGITGGASGNTIGGVATGPINLISGNTQGGVVVFGSGTNNNLVQANRIGLDDTGTVALPNGGSGIAVLQGAANTTMTGNLIAANQGDGIQVAGPGTTGTVIQSNFIGTDPAGANPIPNQFHGVEVLLSATNTTIGGSAPGAGNLISGNGGAGVLIDQNAQGTLVQSNEIGIDIDGTYAVANGQGGVTVSQGATGTVIAGNRISGNQFYGVFFSDSSDGIVQDNLIGTDASGTVALPNDQGGIIITNGSNLTISGNLVSGNNTDGITLNPAQNVVIQGNRIGTDISGTSPLGNGGNGVWVIGSGPVNVDVGTEDPGAGNIIAFNGNDGVLVQDAQSVAILGNSIHDNANLGIELTGQGNNQQAAPQLTAVNSDSTSTTTVEGTLTSTPDTTFTLEFFSDSNLGNPQGAQFLGSMEVTTDDNGDASFVVTFNVGLDDGQAVTATATDDGNNTSAFSQAALVNAAGPSTRDRFFADISPRVLLGQ